ncbi:hypothetical protein Tco_0797770 [Tanacetum coccineum]
MSADSAVTYTSVHSETRSWSIPSEDPYEEVARQFHKADESCSTIHLSFTTPIKDPTIVTYTLTFTSTSRIADIPEADTPPRKRLLLTTPRPGCEVGESFAVAVVRQPEPTIARRVNCSSIDTMETRV